MDPEGCSRALLASQVAMLQLLRHPLEDPRAVDLLLSLLSSRSFLVLSDPRMDALLGPKAPLALRRWVLETVAPRAQ